METIETEHGFKILVASGKVIYFDHQNELHRPDGPAIIHANGDKLYFKHGKLHRTDGPAYMMYGYKLHFINGKYLWK